MSRMPALRSAIIMIIAMGATAHWTMPAPSSNDIVAEMDPDLSQLAPMFRSFSTSTHHGPQAVIFGYERSLWGGRARPVAVPAAQGEEGPLLHHLTSTPAFKPLTPFFGQQVCLRVWSWGIRQRLDTLSLHFSCGRVAGMAHACCARAACDAHVLQTVQIRHEPSEPPATEEASKRFMKQQVTFKP